MYVTVVVFARPHEAPLRLEGVGDHVVDQSVFVPDVGRLELRLVTAVDVTERKISDVCDATKQRSQANTRSRPVTGAKFSSGHLLREVDL